MSLRKSVFGPHRSRWLIPLCALALLVGCAAPSPKAPAPRTTVFYPLPPDPPRIQHLATYANAGDLQTDKESGGLKDFLLGEEKQTSALVRPYGVAMFDGKIYVADSRASGLAIFDLKARAYSLMTGKGAGRMQRPFSVTIDADGTKYVSDIGRNQVLVYDRTDNFVTAYGSQGGFSPVGVATTRERLYVVDIGHHEVQVLDKRTGRLEFKFGRNEDPEKVRWMHQPTNLVIGGDGDVYVVETGNFRVARYTAQGKFVREYGEPGQLPGQFARPKGIAMDRAGRLYIGDSAFQNVQIFEGDGRVLMAFGQSIEGVQGLNLPAGIAIDYDNVELFRGLAAPGFVVEHLILVVSQFGPNQVDVYGFGKMSGAAYPPDEKRDAKAAP